MANHYATILSTDPFATQPTAPLINFANLSTYQGTYGVNYWDPVIFRAEFNITTAISSTSAVDASGNLPINISFKGYLQIYPTAFLTSSPNYFYLNGGYDTGIPVSKGVGKDYAPTEPGMLYVTNGRPFWVNELVDEGSLNVSAIKLMPCSIVNDVINDVGQLIFDFPANNISTGQDFNYTLTVELINTGGKIPRNLITTQNFNIINIT